MVTPPGDAVVPLLSRRRTFAALIQKVQHVLFAMALLWDGVRRVATVTFDADFALGAAETLTSGLVIVSFMRTVRALRRSSAAPTEAAHAHGTDWVDVWLAGMFLVEALVHHHETGHWRRPTLLMAATTLVLGLAHGKSLNIAQRRMGLRISDEGIRFGGRRFRRFQASWDQIAGIRFSESRAVIALKHGSERVLDLADLTNAAQVREALEGAQRRLTAHREQAVPLSAPATRPSP